MKSIRDIFVCAPSLQSSVFGFYYSIRRFSKFGQQTTKRLNSMCSMLACWQDYFSSTSWVYFFYAVSYAEVTLFGAFTFKIYSLLRTSDVVKRQSKTDWSVYNSFLNFFIFILKCKIIETGEKPFCGRRKITRKFLRFFYFYFCVFSFKYQNNS